MPRFITWTINKLRFSKRHVIIEKVKYRIIIFLIQFHLNAFKWLCIKYVFSIIQSWLLWIKWRHSHSFKMLSVSLLSSHHDPHCRPLRSVNWFYDFRSFIDKCNSPSDMVKYFDISNFFPRHWHVLKKLEYSMRYVL